MPQAVLVRILVVEDEFKMAGLLRRGFQEEGYAVDVVGTAEEAVWMGTENSYDALILDVMLPDGDGFSVCRRLREAKSWAPVLMLTARDGVDDRVAGLDSGADDYLTKPFSVRELIARARALLRRSGTAEIVAAEAAEIGGLRIDFKKREVVVEGRGVHLTPTEFKVLAVLAARPGEVLSGRAIVKTLHGYDATEQEAMDLIRVNINRLRQKIEPDPATPRYVQTVRGFGYSLSAGKSP